MEINVENIKDAIKKMQFIDNMPIGEAHELIRQVLIVMLEKVQELERRLEK